VGDIVCVGSCSGLFYEIGIDDGVVRSTFGAAADGALQFHGSPLIVDSLIIFATDQGRDPVGAVYALNARTWLPVWKVKMPFGVPSEAAFDGSSLVYCVSRTDEILALSLSTGQQQWRFWTRWVRPDMEYLREVEIPRGVSSPLYSGGAVLFAGRDSTVYCLDASTGKSRWTMKPKTIITSDPVVHGNHLLFGLDTGELIGLNMTDGQTASVDSLPSLVLQSPALAGDHLIFLGGGDDNRPRDVLSYDLRERRVRWVSSLADSTDAYAYWYVPRVHIWDSCVVVGSTTGLVVGYNLADGAEQWRHRLQGPIRGIGHHDSLLLVGTFEGMLHCLIRSTP